MLKAFGIPRDDSFYISEDDEHHYTVTLTNNMRELINTTHVIKSVGRFEKSNSFFAVAKRRDTSNMTGNRDIEIELKKQSALK